MSEFRKPTEMELDGIQAAFEVVMGAGVLKVHDQHVIICDGYITDGPGYAGPVAIVLWSGGPEIVDTFTLHDGAWSWINKDVDDLSSAGPVG